MTEAARLGIYDILDEIYGGEGEGKNSQRTYSAQNKKNQVTWFGEK